MTGNRDCVPCRTINLAKTILQEKGRYDSCNHLRKPDCTGIPEVQLKPACIRLCNQENPKGKPKVALPKTPHPYYGHGKFMWVVKTGILVGSVYFTYTQGVWGDQQTSMECLNRWAEYIRSVNTRRPPKFDECGNVVLTLDGPREKKIPVVHPGEMIPWTTTKKTVSADQPGLGGSLYKTYKECVTTCFAGVVKVPILLKCAYINYLEALEKKRKQDEIDASFKHKK